MHDQSIRAIARQLEITLAKVDAELAGCRDDAANEWLSPLERQCAEIAVREREALVAEARALLAEAVTVGSR